LKLIQGDCIEAMKEMPDSSIDLIVADPPYGLEFMGKDWDRAVPKLEVWEECNRILKHGSFMFVLSSPRQDVLTQMIMRIGSCGFDVSFSPIYWAYASGFPKAMNIGKMVDKKRVGDKFWELRQYLRECVKKSGLTQKEIKEHLGYPLNSGVIGHWIGISQPCTPSGKDWQKMKEILPIDNRYDDLILEAEREVIGKGKCGDPTKWYSQGKEGTKDIDITLPATQQAKTLDGSYAGFQPKPAVEVILVAMKPLSEKTYVDQALKNSKGITWLDNCRIPYESEDDRQQTKTGYTEVLPLERGWNQHSMEKLPEKMDLQGRFPANLLVSDDVLNDGKISKIIGRQETTKGFKDIKFCGSAGKGEAKDYMGTWPNDSGSFSRYFDLNKWFEKRILKLPKNVKKTFPFLIVPKASKSEKNEGCEELEEKNIDYEGRKGQQNSPVRPNGSVRKENIKKNIHPTVKPVMLMSYLITLGSRPRDIVLDPFVGSGTTLIACKKTNRTGIGIEINPEYCQIARKRLSILPESLDKFIGLESSSKSIAGEVTRNQDSLKEPKQPIELEETIETKVTRKIKLDAWQQWKNKIDPSQISERVVEVLK